MRSTRCRNMLVTSVILILVIVMTGCQSSDPIATPNPESTIEPGQNSISTEPIESITDSTKSTEENAAETEEQQPTEQLTQTIPQAQATPAPTLSDWRDAPISPETISERVLQIYREGQQQGRDPHSFSVIGDCQAIPFVFLGPYGRGELEPESAESQLWNAINTFNPSFKRWSVTARGGFTAASILNPLQADPEQCKPGETPLSCEYRLNNPAFVLITLETWLDPDTVDRYEIYLRQIVEKVLEQGSVPILLTKADSSELRGKEHVINPVIVRVAYENQLPLVNFWRAAQYLDNYGIDPEREGFHLSDAGYKLKNTLALRALYQVWTAVEGLDQEAAIVPTATGTPEPTFDLDVAALNLDCSTGCIFFGTAQSLDGNITGAGVYAYHPENRELTQILPDGFDLQDVSEDGQRLLVNNTHRLYEVDLGAETSSLLTESFNFYGKQGACWDNQDNEIIFLDETAPLQTETGTAYNLIPAADDEKLIFESGSCQSKDYCQSEGVFTMTPDGEISQLETIANPVYSPDGSRVAFLNPEAATAETFFHTRYLVLQDTAVGIASRRILYFPDVSGFMVYADVETYAFSPDSSKVFILYDVYSEYYEYSLRLQTYLWDLNTGVRLDMGLLPGASASLNPRIAWAPDGNSVLLFLTYLTEENHYSISVYQTDLLTGEHMLLFDEAILDGTDYLYLTNLYWR